MRNFFLIVMLSVGCSDGRVPGVEPPEIDFEKMNAQFDSPADLPSNCVVHDSARMKFHFGDAVVLRNGLYEGIVGLVIGHDERGYTVDLLCTAVADKGRFFPSSQTRAPTLIGVDETDIALAPSRGKVSK